MTELLIRHKVGDYETFKKIFLEDEERRRSTGSKRARVLLNADDPKDIWVVLEYDNAEQARQHGWYECATLKEPYRLEGKKTMGYEVAEQMGWKLPDAVLYPTGGGTGLVGMWKAFDEMETMGFIGPGRPRMYAVQMEGCAPIVKAFAEGREDAPLWENARTLAHGLRVPKAIGDFLMLRALRQSHGAGVTVSDPEAVQGVKDAAACEGLFMAPEGGACVAALRHLKASGHLSPDDSIVLFNTGTGLKYVENMAPLW